MFSIGKKSEANQTPSPGPFGRFYLQELINSGGMADIWLATDERHKPYALRRMHERLRFNLLARRRFMRGAEILSKIGDHDHIIGYVEHGNIKGQLYLLMDYVEASNLKELHARQDPVLLENVAQILIDMAEGLEHMHDNGFMHLDFKPENVLVTRNANVRLVDFDLAQPIPEKPREGLEEEPGHARLHGARAVAAASPSTIAWTSSPTALPPTSCSPTRSRSRATPRREILPGSSTAPALSRRASTTPDIRPPWRKSSSAASRRDPRTPLPLHRRDGPRTPGRPLRLGPMRHPRAMKALALAGLALACPCCFARSPRLKPSNRWLA